MKHIGFVGRLLSQLTPFNDKLHAYFDDDQVTKQLEAAGIIRKTVSLNPGSLAAGAVGTATVAVAGLTPDHKIQINAAHAPSAAVVCVGARCVTPGTLTADFVNPTAGALDLAAGDYNILAIPGDLN